MNWEEYCRKYPGWLDYVTHLEELETVWGQSIADNKKEARPTQAAPATQFDPTEVINPALKPKRES